MNGKPGTVIPAKPGQRGGTAIELIVFLAVAAYAIYIGVQYYPQHRESSRMQTILDNVAEQYRKYHFTTEDQVWDAIDRQLEIQGIRDPKANISVIAGPRNSFEVAVRYQRELNLLFASKTIDHVSSVTLR